MRRKFIKHKALTINLGFWLASLLLTLLSIYYQQPSDCQVKDLCWQSPCTDRQVACSFLRAGFPLPFIFDQTAGSPVSGWMQISPDDNISPLMFILNIILYRLLIFIVVRSPIL